MKYDRCPWCNAEVQADRMLGRGYVVRFDLPRIEWECGSGRLNDDVEPIQSDKCVAIVFRELEGLRGAIQNITKQRDDLLMTNHRKMEIAWRTTPAELRVIAEALEREGCNQVRVNWYHTRLCFVLDKPKKKLPSAVELDGETDNLFTIDSYRGDNDEP